MPTYEYKCKNCGHKLEVFQSITDGPLKTCSSCNKDTLERLIGTGSGIIFKGSGFYHTDYRSAAYQKASKTDSPGASTAKEKKSTCEQKTKVTPKE